MIRFMSIALCLSLASIAFAGGTFSDINRGEDKKDLPAYSGDQASQQELEDIQRQEEQAEDAEKGELTDDSQLGTFRIQTQEDLKKAEEDK